MIVTIDLSPEVMARVSEAARLQGVTVEAFLARAADEIARTETFFEERRRRVTDADREWFHKFMNREGGEPPRPGDEIE